MEHALRALKNLLNIRDEEILTNACWAVSYMLEGTDAKKSNHPQTLVHAALHGLGSMMVCDINEISSSPCHSQMQRFISLEGLRCLHSLLKLGGCNVMNKSEVCWIISRFTASTHDMIQVVIDENIVETLVSLLETNKTRAVRKKAILALKFIAIGGDYEQIRHLFMNGCVKALTDTMSVPDEACV